MGILEGIKRTFNIRGSQISVVLEDDIYSQADLIKGEITITAPDYKQAGNAINLELKEFWTETRSTGKTTTTVTVHKTHVKVALHGVFDFEAGSQHRFPFEADLPRNCRISTKHSGWCLAVSMDIPKALDPTERVVLRVEPLEEFLAIMETCEEKLGFQERFNSRRWLKRTSETCFRLIPPEVLKSELDYMAFEISQAEDGSVEGNLIFNLQEKSIGDYFKAMIGRDKIRKPFHLASSNIYAQDGSVNSGEIAEAIMNSLREVIEPRMK